MALVSTEVHQNALLVALMMNKCPSTQSICKARFQTCFGLCIVPAGHGRNYRALKRSNVKWVCGRGQQEQHSWACAEWQAIQKHRKWLFLDFLFPHLCLFPASPHASSVGGTKGHKWGKKCGNVFLEKTDVLSSEEYLITAGLHFWWICICTHLHSASANKGLQLSVPEQQRLCYLFDRHLHSLDSFLLRGAGAISTARIHLNYSFIICICIDRHSECEIII